LLINNSVTRRKETHAKWLSWEHTAITDNGALILQACAHSKEDVPGSVIETCSTSSHDEIQTISIKDEEISDIEVEEDPLLMSSPGIEVEHVSCIVSSFSDSRDCFIYWQG
jgi:hypothetical protein